ncbi:hypothetical protein RFI_21070 [Reticulomyxa filosa]|uniref:CHAT domain-containing protein n=1 Tax=Reticulomyxa filosa TaxID=46433 RepID=X6MQK0_RETFI|nr:hypothetical protein RFI_21070 [Reticulomyxa filosa]|eukprot:ETO16283.1 hypothetical protein RFI_21070 [Reticulomyxa filosa]
MYVYTYIYFIFVNLFVFDNFLLLEHILLEAYQPKNESFFKQQLDIAVLHSSPLDAGDAFLDLEEERHSLETMFGRCEQPLGVFFGVLTEQSLISCIQRGAKILHISGHGSNAQTLQVQDHWGGMNTISANVIRQALEETSSQLVLVFVSTCFSEQVAKAFVEVGVPNVVAVHSLVQINNKTAMEFALNFYQNLLGQKKTVVESFKNARAVFYYYCYHYYYYCYLFDYLSKALYTKDIFFKFCYDVVNYTIHCLKIIIIK